MGSSAKRSHPLVRLTYADPFWEMNEGDESEVYLMTVVGWSIPCRFPGHVAVAGEKGPQGWRSITYVPEAIVVRKEEL